MGETVFLSSRVAVSCAGGYTRQRTGSLSCFPPWNGAGEGQVHGCRRQRWSPCRGRPEPTPPASSGTRVQGKQGGVAWEALGSKSESGNGSLKCPLLSLYGGLGRGSGATDADVHKITAGAGSSLHCPQDCHAPGLVWEAVTPGDRRGHLVSSLVGPKDHIGVSLDPDSLLKWPGVIAGLLPAIPSDRVP